MTAVDDLAAQIVGLEKKLNDAITTPQLAYSSIENGALRAHDDALGNTMTIGRQWDGTYAPLVDRGPVPPTPSDPTVVDATEGIVVFWDGTFTNALLAPMDFLRVDIHVGSTAGFVPDHTNRRGTIAAPLGGNVSITLPYGTYWVKLVCWSLAGNVSLASAAVSGDAWPIEVSTDGFAPASSPDPTALSGIEMIAVRWTPITNADPVTYQVHISTTLGFTPDSTTLIGTTDASSFWIKGLPGPDPAPGDIDTRTLQYDIAYYIRIVATDADGAAAPSLQAVGSVFQVTGVNLAADSVTAQNIVAGSLTGELFSASVVVAGTFKSGETGQRVEWGAAGIQGYRSDGSLILNIPTDGSTALFDGEFIIRGATITGGISIQNSQNEMTADSAMTLMSGVVSPSATPAVTVVWDSVRPSTASLTAAQKTGTDPQWGLGGPFDFDASAVSNIEWKPAENMWIFQHIRPNGTRSWYFNPDGTPKDRYGTGVYFSDVKDWEIWSTTEIYSGAKAGVYTIFRFIPSGTTWYINGPGGFNQYNRLNTGGTPALGNNGTDFFIAEIVSGSHLRVNFHSMGPDGTTLPGPGTTYEAAAGFSTSLCGIQFSSTGFDIGSPRYAVAQRGVSYDARLLERSGTVLIPGGSGGWASSTAAAESWESPTTNRRGQFWDGTNFYTLGGDGLLYKHSAERWDPSVTPSNIWHGLTFKDTDAAGTGTHQTKMGPLKMTTHKRRAKLQLVAPAVPDNGGVDDPDKVQWYAQRLAVSPTSPWAGMFAQGSPIGGITGPASLQLTTLATTGANPPTTNTFPASNPAKFRNADDTLSIDGSGAIKGSSIAIGATPVLALTQVIQIVLGSNYDYTATEADIPGFTSTFSTVRANAKYLCICSISAAAVAASNADSQAKLSIDGTVQGPTIHFTGLNTTPARANVSQTWSGTLATVGSHTFKMRAINSTAGAVRANAGSSTLTIMIYE